MKIRRANNPEPPPERAALIALIASFAGRLDALDASQRETQALLATMPERIAWAVRYATDAEEVGPELLTAVAAEVASFKIEHPAAYSDALANVTERATCQ
jgi:hypothetical protein